MIINPNKKQNSPKIPAAPSRPQTIDELAALTKIRQYNRQHHLTGDKLPPKRDETTKYYLFEVGLILKYNSETYLCKRLDLEKMEWVPSQNSISLFYDTTYDFRELTEFQDYYPDTQPKLR